jgi:hypothetical protein
MTRPTLENPDIYDPTIWRGNKLGTDQIGNVANFVITAAHPTLMVITPTGAQNIRLPLEASSTGLMFIIVNAAAGAFALTVQTSTGAALGFGNGLISQNQMGIFVCDGLQWRGMVAAATQTSP